MEEVLVEQASDRDRVWIMVELFEGIPWVEDVIDSLGPQTTALLREAQDVLALYAGCIGRWKESLGTESPRAVFRCRSGYRAARRSDPTAVLPGP